MRLRERDQKTENPYSLALQFCLEKAHDFFSTPIGRRVSQPQRQNRAFEMIEQKFQSRAERRGDGLGAENLPLEKRKAPAYAGGLTPIGNYAQSSGAHSATEIAKGKGLARALRYFCFAMNASMFLASTTIGTPPPITSASSNWRRSNFAPSAFCAFVRSRLISL